MESATENACSITICHKIEMTGMKTFHKPHVKSIIFTVIIDFNTKFRIKMKMAMIYTSASF